MRMCTQDEPAFTTKQTDLNPRLIPFAEPIRRVKHRNARAKLPHTALSRQKYSVRNDEVGLYRHFGTMTADQAAQLNSFYNGARQFEYKKQRQKMSQGIYNCRAAEFII